MILVTGGAGFIGRNLVGQLLEAGHDVRVLDNFSRGRALPKRNGLKVFVGDIRNAPDVHSCMEGCSHVIHLAVEGMTECAADPYRDVSTNVYGSMNVLMAAREEGAKVIFTSSCSVYGDQYDGTPTTEETTPEPFTPYAAGKIAVEGYIRSFMKHGWLDATILRPSNVYGPGQHPESHVGVIGHFIMNRLLAKVSVLHGGGGAVRDFTYVDDVVRAIMLSMDYEGIGPFNVSSCVGTSVKDLANLISGAYIPEPPREIDLVDKRILSNESIREWMGWEPQVSLEEGLVLTELWMAPLLQEVTS